MAKKKWSELPPLARVAVAVAGALQVGLLVAAQVDITRRPAGAIRGPKWRWRLISMINFIGPLAYFARGRQALTRPSLPA
jgi:hypothetical protein